MRCPSRMVVTSSVSPSCCGTCRCAHLGGHARGHGVPRALHDARGLLWARTCGRGPLASAAARRCARHRPAATPGVSASQARCCPHHHRAAGGRGQRLPPLVSSWHGTPGWPSRPGGQGAPRRDRPQGACLAPAGGDRIPVRRSSSSSVRLSNATRLVRAWATARRRSSNFRWSARASRC